MQYTIERVQGHYIIRDEAGDFCGSADSELEARQDIIELEKSKGSDAK